jgi:hypothetical protein
MFQVRSIKELELIINHFDSYPLKTKKFIDYVIFKEIYSLVKNKEHLTTEGINNILKIKASAYKKNINLSEISESDLKISKSQMASLNTNQAILEPE